MSRTLIILFTFCFMGWFLFTYKLLDVPPGINGDEAAIGHLASLIAKSGRDANGNFLPIFSTLSWPDWKQPVTIYSTVIAFKLFGISFYNLRVVSVFFVLLSGIIIFLLAKEVFNTKFAFFSLLVFITIPIVMIQSHLAIENIAPLPFVAFWLWMLAKYTKNKKTRYLFFAGVSLGASLYSYLGLRLVMPILTLLSICYIYYLNNTKKKKINLGHLFIFVIALVPFFIFLIIIKEQYPAAVFALNKPQNLSSYQQFFLPYISSFDLSFLFMKGDLTPYHSTGRQGMFLLATLPLFLLGLAKLINDKKPFLIFILLVFFLAPLLYGLPGSIYRASRLIALLPSFILICLLGIKNLLGIKRKFIRVLLVSVMVIIIFVNYIDFVIDYWFDYPQRVNQSFEKPLHKVFDFASNLAKKEHLEVFIQDDAPLRNPTVYAFLENAYFPKGLKRWSEGTPLPSHSIIMVSAQVYRRMNRPKSIVTIDNGDMDLNLLINKSDENK